MGALRLSSGTIRRVSMPEPVDDAQRVVVNEIWDFLLTNGRWPTFTELDHRLYQNHDLQGDDVLPRLPAGLLHGVQPGAPGRTAESTTIGLTVAGVHATGRGRQELMTFLAVVRYAAELERNYEPSPDQPGGGPLMTSAQVAETLKLPEGTREGLLTRIGPLLRVERWGWSGASGADGPTWDFRVDREVRRFRAVEDLDTYWQLRPKHWESQPPAWGIGARAEEVVPATSPPANPAVAGQDARESVHEALQSVLAAVALAVAGFQLGWGALRTISLIGVTTAAVLAWHRWRTHRRRTHPWLIVLAIVCAISLALFIATFTSVGHAWSSAQPGTYAA